MSKPRKCRICKAEYAPFTSLQKTCSISCSIKLVQVDRAKEEARTAKERRKDTRQRREKLKTRSDWLREAEKACNEYVRYRDRKEPCISCQRHHTGQYHAGHYKSKGAYPELRYHANFNISKQCSACNDGNKLSGNIHEYRKNLIKKIGIKNVEWLEGPHKAQNWSIDDIKEIKQYYREQLKLIRRGI